MPDPIKEDTVSTNRSTCAQVQDAAGAHGWHVERMPNRTGFVLTLARGDEWVAVTFDRRRAIVKARVGKLGGYEITGPGKLAKIRAVVGAGSATDVPEAPEQPPTACESGDRDAFIAGLRALAEFLDSNPTAPVPVYTSRFSLAITLDTDEEERAQVDAFAAATGAKLVRDGSDGYYIAERWFGPIAYEACAVSEERMREYAAEQSYHGCVQPDEAPVREERAA